ncbi:hypothetical protein jhhlp_008141 [Lomentospora prolificans]|uniref:Amidohydrolase 3 domain-containing protein n=1 Tax=Lomentospora prolificans TaxID=41688 RepID=A0A2N3MZN6_9PEZI|nr:hypothetical protein jhhlp_008141 [Lomentospora prolificans]
MPKYTILQNARVFQSTGLVSPKHSFVNCLVVDNDTGRIAHVGAANDAKVAELAPDAASQDMNGRIILPGFIDGHMHLLVMGQALKKLPLDDCRNLDDIRSKITAFAAAHPEAERILCRGWMPFMTNGEAHSSMLEGLDDRPIFIDSKSLHSTWCSEAALKELEITNDTPSPTGGIIHRDANGNITGVLSEACVFLYVWPHLARVSSKQESIQAIKAAINAYLAHGYTGLVEMAMEDNTWEALLALKEQEGLPVHVAAYWLIRPSETEDEAIAQVDRVIELRRKFNSETSPDCRIAGIKIICDGIVDACTAALTVPYSNGATADLLWSLEALKPVIERASKAGLQCALHAMGDLAISTALDALEPHATPDSRHRMEHLELASARDARRLGQLGITASIQAVHADPAILRAWPSLLGSARCSRAFAYSDFAREGAVLALGSDAPTSPYDPFQNLYTATTRRSAREPESEEVVNPHFALSLAAALTALTEGSAYSIFADQLTGKLEVGKLADLAVIDMEWDVEKLLSAKVVQTWSRGKVVYDGEK